MPETPYDPEDRLGRDLSMRTAYQPPVYDQPKEGPGRWCVLYARAGDEQLGYLWAGDNGSLGFVAVGDAGIVRGAEFAAAFSKAKGAGTRAADVFADYASRASLGLSAGPVAEGDLATLPE